MNFDNSNSIESKKPPEPKSCAALLLEFEKIKKEIQEAGKEIEPGFELTFLGLMESEEVSAITSPFSINEDTVMAASVKDKKIDAYNGTTPFEIGGKKVIAQRVEPRGNEFDSRVYFFESNGPDERTWIKIEDAPVFKMQDPFQTTVTVNNENINIIGGVEVSRNNEERHTFNRDELQTIGDEIDGLLVNSKTNELNSLEYNRMQLDLKMLNKAIQESKGIMTLEESNFISEYGRKRFRDLHSFLAVTWQTVFYKGTSLNTLERFAVVPNMKGVRIVDLKKNGHIGVFVRPQGEEYGGGMIGYIELNSLEDLTPENISKAEIIEGLCIPDEWVGANQLHLREHGKIGVIGHIACFDENNVKCYYAMSFIFDPKTRIATPVKIIATIDDFPPGDAKKPELKRVFYPSGISGIKDKDEDKDEDDIKLWGGLGDARAGAKHLSKHPF